MKRLRWLVIGILVIVTCWIGINVYKYSQPPQVIFGADTAAEEGTILWYLKYHNYKLERKSTYPILFGFRQDMFTLHHIAVPSDILVNPTAVAVPRESTLGVIPESSGAVSVNNVTVSINWMPEVLQMRIEVPGFGYGVFHINEQGNLKVVDQGDIGIQTPPANR
ncbi:hypothetical protein J4G08_08045 [Candidatus Poribacteria bacterium]|nr:hypothetical protein [Candidatus Poribacteria bacterium]